jgi:hypothetical protein
MNKNWKTRLTETWDEMDKDKTSFPAARLQTIKDYHANLTDPQRKTVSEAMAQGEYGVAKADRPAEHIYRKYRRMLILILTAKANTGAPANDVVRASQALAASMIGDQAVSRCRFEMQDVAAAVQKVKDTMGVDSNWGGWDSVRRRPLLAGCSIGRRGSNGPGTLGCFVRRGNDVFILSNRHVLYQLGSGAIPVDDDREVIQPPHQLGGTFFDSVAEVVELDGDHDAAMARIKSGIVCINRTPEGVDIAGSGAAGPKAAVWKRGCASGVRKGIVTEPKSADVATPGFLLKNQLIVTRDNDLDAYRDRVFQIQGDSGSVLLNHANQVVALLHGREGATGAQGTHIGPILARFGVTVLVGSYTAP